MPARTAGTHRAPSYLKHHPSGYIFRYCIPKDVQAVVNRKELRYSLRTGKLGLAKVRARAMATATQRIIARLRSGNMPELQTDQIHSLLKDWLKWALDTAEERRIVDPPTNSLDDRLQNLDIAERFTKDQLVGKHPALKGYHKQEVEENILKRHGLTADKESLAYKKLNRDYLKVYLRFIEILKRREQGDYSDELSFLDADPKAASDVAPRPSDRAYDDTIDDSGPKLTEVIQHYISEAETVGQWTAKSQKEIQSSLDLFVKVIGDIPFKSIDRPDVREFKETLLKLPPNMSKIPRYKDKAIKELLAMDHPKTMALGTVNKLLGRVSTFFNYAVKNGFIGANPADNLQVAVKKRPDEFRDAFDTEDLKALFGSKEYREDGFKRGYQFWTPIIALYTGCRIEEICQLHLDDIRKEDGLWVLDINDDKEKKLKNMSSKRLVPLHPVLVDELNLPAYAESLRAGGHTRLFPNLKQQRDGYSQNVSKWFGRYRARCGINSPKKTFHSFRHTFITAMKHKVANISVLHELHGHALEGMTMARYGKKYPPRVLYDEAVSKLDYPLNWGGVGGSRWIVG